MSDFTPRLVKNMWRTLFLITPAFLVMYPITVNLLIAHEAENGDARAIRILLNCGANVDAVDNGRTPLMYAVQNRHMDAIRTLLASHADVNAKYEENGMTSLMMAASDGQMAMVKALINAGADVKAHDKLGRSVLWWALQTDKDEFKPTGYDPKVITLLRAAGAK